MTRLSSLLFSAAICTPLLLGCDKTEAPPATTPDGAGTPASESQGEASPAAEGNAAARASVGKPAPDFTLKTLSGETVSLSAFKGKVVVLEWFNPDCPFVRQSHTAGSLEGMAGKVVDDDTVWLAINANAEGKQGHSEEANRAGQERYGIDYPILLDRDGSVARSYGAERTPQIYVIDKTGTLVYVGAVDNSGGGDLEDADPLETYAADAIAAAKKGEPVAKPQTEAWGCTVKYAD